MKWVLVDLSYLAHRAKHALKDLEYEDMPTGVMYGFFEQLITICSDPIVASNRVLLFADSKKSYRRKMFPDYKRKRREEKTKEEVKEDAIFHKQLKILRKDVFPATGLPIYQQVGLESDDLMAQAAYQLGFLGGEAILITADGDMWQCISPFVQWYDPVRKKLYDVGTFLKQKKILPHRWRDVKALAGCNSDEVPGVPGVGEKTAIKYLEDELPIHYKSYKAIKSEEGMSIIKRNHKLVDLPHANTKPIILREPNYNPEAFFSFCEQFGIDSFTEKPNRWNRFFKGKFQGLPRRRHGKKKKTRGSGTSLFS